MAAKDMLRHALIGTEVEVIDASNKSLIGLMGKVIAETKSTLVIEKNNKEKSIPKKNTKMKIKFKNSAIEVLGDLLVGRPEDRMKKRIQI